MPIEPKINPVNLGALGDPSFVLRLPNLEQDRSGTLPTLSHGGQLRVLIRHLGGKE